MSQGSCPGGGGGGGEFVGVRLGEGEPVVMTPPVQVVPLSAKLDGTALAPVHAPLNPNDVVAPVAIDALYDMLVAVTAPPDWATVAFHAWVTVCPLGNVQASRHPLIGSPRLVMSTFAPNPPCHWLVTV